MNTFAPAPSAAGVPQTAKAIADLSAHSSAVVSLAFTPDRSLLISTGRDGAARVWTLASSKPGGRGEMPRGGDPFRSIACAPNSRLVALGSDSLGGTVRLFDITESTPAEGATLRGARGCVLGLAFSADGKLIAGGGEDNTLRIWEPGPGFRGDARGVLPGHTKPITATAFSPDAQTAATASQDATVKLWRLSRIRSSLRASLAHPAEVLAMAFIHDGKSLITACRDGRIRVWDLTPITPAVRTEFAGHAGGTRVLAPTSAETLAGTADGSTVTTWDVRSGKAVSVWEVPGGAGTCAALTSDGRYLARGLATGGVGVYRVAEKRA